MKPVRLSLAQIVCRYLPPLFSAKLRSWIYPMETAFRDDYKFVVRSHTGSFYKNTTSDRLGYEFSVHGFWDWRNLAVVLSLCSVGDTIIEIGANTGTETVAFSDILGKSGRVIAFEPLPSNIGLLKENLRLLNNVNVDLYTCAVGEEHKSVRFVPPPKINSSGSGFIDKNFNTNASDINHIDVDCITLDEMMDKIPISKILYMYVEGHELFVLRGAKNLLKRDKPFIILEAARKHLARNGMTPLDLYTILESYGYRNYHISRFGISKINLKEIIPHCNWLCVPTENLEAERIADRKIKICGILPFLPGLNPISNIRFRKNN